VSFLLRVFVEEETREIEGKPATAG
jgi:hypothetical protein